MTNDSFETISAGSPKNFSPASVSFSNASPWGIASGAEESHRYPEFLPLLKKAGVTWLRYFPEWGTVQRKEGEWDFSWGDGLVKACREQGINLTGIFLYFAPWASSDNSSRGFPVRSLQSWSDYVYRTVSRYRDDVQYWEIWNEGNSPVFNHHGSPKDYSNMVCAAYNAGKAANPNAKFGITCAAFDLHYFDQVIKAGAAGHFDYICVHPYDSIGYTFGAEDRYLAMAGNVRAMLAANNQDSKMPIWITEIGLTTTETQEQQRRQANALVRSYVLNIAQGIEKTFWFEAAGPKYGEGVHAILTDDMQPRAAYNALAKLAGHLGPEPHFLGWRREEDGTLRFAFDNNGRTALVQWHDDSDPICSYPDADITLNSPGISLGQDFSSSNEITCHLGETNLENGLRQGSNDPRADGVTIPGGDSCGTTWRSSDLRNRRPFIYFDIDPSFAGWNDRVFEITVTARRANPDVPAVCTLVYESVTGYHEYGKRTTTPGLNTELLYESENWRAPDLWYLDRGDAWQTHTWRIEDACFIGKWGWHFQLNAEMSSGDISVSEIRVKKKSI
ncbi:MAG: hypothetical protein GX804_08680 [Lentisphaerae bacterium]|jgi:hypothetical protein|nr:hypothetical protein [Lentisphaerota bacterium]